MTTATTPVEALEMGLEIIKEKGWVQETLQGPTGAVCSIGAIRAATYGLTKRGSIRMSAPKGASKIAGEAQKFLSQAIVRRTKDSKDPFAVINYNDEEGRTASQIYSLFRSAIRLAQKAAGQ